MTKKEKFFEHGDMTLIAKQCGVSRSRLCDIFHRRRNVRTDTAKKIAIAIVLVTGKSVPWSEIINTKYSNHPAFEGSPEVWGN
jgi:hypothetical protein